MLHNRGEFLLAPVNQVFAVCVATAFVAFPRCSPNEMPRPIRPARDAGVAHYFAIYMSLQEKYWRSTPMISLEVVSEVQTALLAFLECAQKINVRICIRRLRMGGERLRHESDQNRDSNSLLQNHAASLRELPVRITHGIVPIHRCCPHLCFALNRKIPHSPLRLIVTIIIAAFTGLVAGAVHVWTGPDHLAAVAPLAMRRPRAAWLPGARWGLGHSAGVALVGLLLLALKDILPVDWISTWGERLVGVMLFGIGLWALKLALKENVHAHEHEHDGDRHVHIHTHNHGHSQEQPDAHRHTHAAFGIGTLHGLAGSSHFLGVLPALALPTKIHSVAFLISFGVGTVAAMATFSWGLGWIANRMGSRGAGAYRGLMGVSAAVAIGVGCFWIATSWK